MREHRHAGEPVRPEAEAEAAGPQAPASDPDGAVAALAQALRPLDRGIRDLLRDATHQLRTPLTSITGYLELLADGAAGPVTGEQARLLEAAARNSARLAGLIDALEP